VAKPKIVNATNKVIPPKKLKIVEQKQSSTCGPAALRILLSFFDIDKSETYLARLCRTTKRDGTHPWQLVTALKKIGFRTKSEKWGTWEKLDYWINKRGLPVIVDWYSPADDLHDSDGHYSVAYRLSKTHIWLADPKEHLRKERRRKLSWDDFQRHWFDFEGNYIRRLKDMEVRWWLAAYPAPLSKIKK